MAAGVAILGINGGSEGAQRAHEECLLFGEAGGVFVEHAEEVGDGVHQLRLQGGEVGIVAGLVASGVISYACDYVVSQKKIFGGTTPGTVSDKEWWQATEKRFQAWPRTAGPPVVMNPISRQNFIVKDLKP